WLATATSATRGSKTVPRPARSARSAAPAKQSCAAPARQSGAAPARQSAPAETIRVAASIPMFMVPAYDSGGQPRRPRTLHDQRSHRRVRLHPLELLRRQAAGLTEDGLRHRQFADIVQNASDF